MRTPNIILLVTLLGLFLLPGCGDDPPPAAPGYPPHCSDGILNETETGVDCGGACAACVGCSPETQSGCGEGLICENVVGGTPGCFAPVAIKGRVFDVMTDGPIEGARVVARDPNESVVSKVAISAADGTYELQVPARRDASGIPVDDTLTLRADAEAYLTFPKPPRVALPIDLTTGTGDPPIIEGVPTEIGLIPLTDTAGLGSISGTVHSANPGGTLVVASGVTGVADLDGSYAVFNVPAGSVQVSGYAVDVNLESVTADVVAAQETTGVDLNEIGSATAVVSGKVQIVNAPGGSVTTVVLAVEETFQELTFRGEVPKGLRATNVNGDWSISGVPDGRYVVLAAFENDDLVRDPDTSIGGTEIVHIQVNGADYPIADGFKVTEALDVVSPGASEPEVVSGTPTFTWEDDSSEDSYDVVVFDALGELIWETSGPFDPGGSDPASVDYGGEALTPGMYYQFRATSIKDTVPISSTEDLRGVFIYQ